MKTKKSGVELIAEERLEQIKKHGKTSEHDDRYSKGELVNAAVVCLDGELYWKEEDIHGPESGCITFHICRMDETEWKLPLEKNRVHQLKVAGALMAAEIDRLQRIKNKIRHNVN